MTLLSLRDVNTFIGQFHILEGVDVDVPTGSIVALLGRNGAGKTTTLRTILGLERASSGSIIFEGQELTGRHSYDIASLGIGYVPENRAIFGDLSVLENLLIAERQKGDFERKRSMIFDLFPDLERLIRLAGTDLSGGQQQMLAVARALVPDNRLLLIDEPSEGLAPVIIEQMMEAIRVLSAETTVLLVEQNFIVASRLASSYVIIEEGRSVRAGTMADLQEDTETVNRFLGMHTTSGSDGDGRRMTISEAGRRNSLGAWIRANRTRVTVLAVLAFLFFTALQGLETDAWFSTVLQGLSVGAITFLVASGLSLIFGLMDVLNLAHGEIFMIGAYVGWTIYTRFDTALDVLTPLFVLAAPFALLPIWRRLGTGIRARLDATRWQRIVPWANDRGRCRSRDLRCDQVSAGHLESGGVRPEPDHLFARHRHRNARSASTGYLLRVCRSWRSSSCSSAGLRSRWERRCSGRQHWTPVRSTGGIQPDSSVPWPLRHCYSQVAVPSTIGSSVSAPRGGSRSPLSSQWESVWSSEC